MLRALPIRLALLAAAALVVLTAPGMLEARQDEPAVGPGAPLPEGLPRAGEVGTLTSSLPFLSDRVRMIYWPGGRVRAERMLEVLESRARLPGLPENMPPSADFLLAPDREVWDALTGGRVPEWGAGVAIPDRGISVIPLFNTPAGGPGARDRTAVHEWAHLGLHSYLDELAIPRWFDEGYAQWASGGWDVRQAWRLRVALASGAAPPLDSIVLRWPRQQARAEVAYLLTASAVEFLLEPGGERGLEVFLERWREVGSFEAAFRRTFGETTGAFESRWIEHVEDRYGWILIFNDLALFWAFAGLALLVLVRFRLQRSREQMAKLRATEPPARPAYWEPPPMPPIGGYESERRLRTPPVPDSAGTDSNGAES